MFVDQGEIEGFGALKIVIAKFVFGVCFKIVKVIIELERSDVEAVFAQALGQFDCRRCFARAGWTGNDDDSQGILLSDNFISQTLDVGVINILGGLNQFADSPFANEAV